MEFPVLHLEDEDHDMWMMIQIGDPVLVIQDKRTSEWEALTVNFLDSPFTLPLVTQQFYMIGISSRDLALANQMATQALLNGTFNLVGREQLGPFTVAEWTFDHPINDTHPLWEMTS